MSFHGPDEKTPLRKNGMRVCYIILLMVIIPFTGGDITLYSQTSRTADLSPPLIDFSGESKEVPAHRINSPIELDGILNETVWQLTGVTGFTQQEPDEGKPATEKTRAWVAYDHDAIYVAVRAFDDPDSIIARLGRRDEDLDSDWIGVGIDAYRDLQTGFYFVVTPAGSMEDGVFYNDSWSDDTWDGVWDYGIHTDSLGWTVEMRIPYSQLRFIQKDEYIWGFNVARWIQRRQELSFLVAPLEKAANMFPCFRPWWVSAIFSRHPG